MWNHRLVRSDDVVQVAEVYYDDEHQPWGWTQADALWTKSDEESDPEPAASIRSQLWQMLTATKQPILSHPADFVGTSPLGGDECPE